jgi:imidazolonepropionase-like amidohydrolase
LSIANGVTSVRDMGSDLAEVVNWRREIESGAIVGPRITTSGQILESTANVARMKKEATVEPVDRIRLPLANPADGRRAVRQLKAGGADHLKMRTTPDIAFPLPF